MTFADIIPALLDGRSITIPQWRGRYRLVLLSGFKIIGTDNRVLVEYPIMQSDLERTDWEEVE